MSSIAKPADIVLESDRLWLRRMHRDDVDTLFSIFGDSVAMEHFPAPWTRDDVTSYIERMLRRYAEDGYGLWIVIRKDTGEAIGDCGLIRQGLPTGCELEVGYHFRRDHWGKGFATEAARQCMRHAFGGLSAQQLISLIRPANLASRRVAEGNGLRVTHEIVWHELTHLVYAITREEWERGQSS